MTNPNSPLPATRSFHRAPSRAGLARIFGVVALTLVTGCEKPPPPPPPPPPKKEAPPPPPQPVEVAPIMGEVKPDARVQFPQAAAPVNADLARASIKLADAIAKGDAKALGTLLDGTSKSILDSLVAGGGWEEGTKKIEAVRIAQITESDPVSIVTLAVQEQSGAYALCWGGISVGGSVVFAAVPAINDVTKRASDWDGKPGVDSTAMAALAASLAQPAEGLDPLAENKDEPEGEKKEEDPGFKVKNTPGGPVKVPTTTPGQKPEGPGGG